MYNEDITGKESEICRRLKPIGRILEDSEYNVWCCAPMYDSDGKVHVFYSRWLNKYDHAGWISACEVAHAVADSPEGPYVTLGAALSGSGGSNWDSWSIHNPTVYKVNDKYVMLYMGADGSKLGISKDDIPHMSKEEYWPYYNKLLETKRVGMAIATDLNGPWERVGITPVIQAGPEPSWDDFCTSNPAFVITPEGKYRIYFKGWDHKTHEAFHGNRKYGFAEADKLEGPYIKYHGNPVIDFSHIEEKMQCEDAYVWYEDGIYKIIMRDMGYYNHEYGLYMQSENGVEWGNPQIAYKEAPYYFNEALPGIDREGRFERPQLLMKYGKPQYLFGAYRGGKHRTSSGVVLKIEKY
jgi:hypothetical protein